MNSPFGAPSQAGAPSQSGASSQSGAPSQFGGLPQQGFPPQFGAPSPFGAPNGMPQQPFGFPQQGGIPQQPFGPPPQGGMLQPPFGLPTQGGGMQQPAPQPQAGRPRREEIWANMSDDELLNNFNRIRRKWERMLMRMQLAFGIPPENVGRCLIWYAQQFMMNPVPTLRLMVADIPAMRATSQTGFFPM
ncbi:hypothetical protein CB0940_09934 [Cercospora beticola]|uniref:Uncharacterized protein n=1 Tax=Cercospora beticola TaxID=122368 RepID=A0A2G5HH14_CERBT|nr:hypothetical protein CB0940_09934 [Cercospora beticola]PIA91828.1 hypothetical protein CB0940_09934 [Cercospora beticola]WPB05718.1 hypothetical protein RHO25_010372 [Cercospora beticola]CAK1365567.1 unnamed protein product [Cercospora beticola]